jgi:hypothetical protein
MRVIPSVLLCEGTASPACKQDPRIVTYTKPHTKRDQSEFHAHKFLLGSNESSLLNNWSYLN